MAHLALIVDDGVAWADARAASPEMGRRRALEAALDLVEAAPALGVQTLSLIAPETLGDRDPGGEAVSGETGARSGGAAALAARLAIAAMRDREFRLIDLTARRATEDGARDEVRDSGRDEVRDEVRDSGRLTVVVSAGRDKSAIAAAAERLAQRAARGEIDPASIDEVMLDREMRPDGATDPDLILITGGVRRLSDAMIWRAAYAELMFLPDAWPDVTPAMVGRAIFACGRRERRFGGLSG